MLERIYSRPGSANFQWRDIEALFLALGTEVIKRNGSRVEVLLFNEARGSHRPHPSPTADKGAVASVHQWLEKVIVWWSGQEGERRLLGPHQLKQM